MKGDPTVPLTHARLRRRKACKHPKRAHYEGPRKSALYGSWATQVCGECGAWRLELDIMGKRLRWKHEVLETERRDDEY